MARSVFDNKHMTFGLVPRRASAQLSLVVALCLSLGIGWFGWHTATEQYRDARKNLYREANVLAANIAFSSSQHLILSNYSELENLLLKSANYMTIHSIEVIDLSGLTLSMVDKDADGNPHVKFSAEEKPLPGQFEAVSAYENGNFIVRHPIILDEPLAWVRIYYNLDVLELNKSTIIKNTLMAGLVNFFAIFFLMTWLVGRQVNKLKQVIRFADGLSERYGSKVDISSGTEEIQALANALNMASEKIYQQNLSIIENEEKVRLLLDSTGESIYGIDMEGCCTFANPACAKMLGYDSFRMMLGKHMHQLMHHTRVDGSHYPVEECLIHRCHADGQHAHSDKELFWRKDGSLFPVEYWSYPIRRDSEIIGSVVTFIDITQRKQAEVELRKHRDHLEEMVSERTRDLQRSNDSLEQSLEQLRQAQTQLVESEKMAALGGLVAGVAHEINTPVGVGVTAASHLDAQVEKYSKLYQSNQLTRSDFEALLNTAATSSNMILANLKRAAELVSSFKQIAVDQSADQQRHFKLKLYLEEILHSLYPRLKNTSHSVTVSCPDTLELYSYPGAFYQIITNLVMNSLIHGFERIEGGEIRIDVSQEQNAVHIHYSDNGQGIDAEHRDKIFEPFFTTKRNEGGSGLGMHVVYNLVVQALGGQIQCDSIPGQGTRFHIRIPKQE